MIEAAPRTKGSQTREKCLQGVKGLLAAVSRRLRLMQDGRETKTIILEINSANGVLSASESQSRVAEPLLDGSDPDELLGEILDQLDQLALPDCHRTIRIEIVSVKGALSAIHTGITRYRWDV